MAKLTKSIANNESRNLWKELKTIRTQVKVCPAYIKGATNSKDLLRNKYHALYNSNHFHLESVLDYEELSHYDHIRITNDNVDQAIQPSKPRKR